MAKKIITKAEKKWDLGSDTDTIDDPLTDCLAQLSKLHGHPVSKTAIRAGLPLVGNRLTVQLTARAAHRAGLSSRVLNRPLAKMTNLELPTILLLDEQRACILLAINQKNNTLTVLLPETGMGKEEIPMSVMEKSYTGYSIFVHPRYRDRKDSIAERSSKNGNWFWGTLFSSWRIYRDVLMASFLINALGLATPFFILNVYDRVIPNSAFDTLWVLAIGIGVIYLFSLLMRGLRGYFIDEAGKKANLKISALLFEKVLGLRMEVRPKSTGSFSKNLQQFDTIKDFITSFSITAIIDLPFVVLGLLAIWYIGGASVIVHLVAIVTLILYAFFIQFPLKKAVEKSFHASAQKNAILVEGLSGIETIKMLGAESQIQRSWEESVSHISQWSSRSRFLSSSVNHVAAFVQSVTVVAVVIAGVYLISNGQMSQGGLIAVVILTRQAIGPMTQVVSLAARFHRVKTALTTLKKIMEMPVERPPNKTFLHRTRFDGKIELKDVSFSYPEQTSPALKDINLIIQPGEKVAVIGPIGSGKTTLGKLLLGLYEPKSGMVAMDGTDIRQIDPAEIRRYIGCVPQDVTLFRGSVRDNITLGANDAEDSDIIRAARLSGVAGFVEKHPKGYDMEVGENGRALSGGQRQTIAMARAVLLDPPIMVLDEPSSSMDAKTESNLRGQLGRILKKKTLLLITHRASLLALVERLIVIDGGKIIADGPKAEVLEALKSGQIEI
ncbi:MAG: type I secretion system permease/ATPase [Thermodesulfobacteriota bacterium]